MRPSILYSLLAALACAAGFLLVLVFAYGGGEPAHADAVALHGFMTLDTPSVDRLAAPIALSMNPVPMLIVVSLICGAGLLAGRKRHVLVALAAVAGTNVTAQILKVALAHDRFDSVLGSDQIEAAALPSGHATAVMSLALAAVLIAPRAVRPLAAVLSGAYACAVCFSVLVLGWHFPSDMVAGMLIATGFGCLSLVALRYSEGRAPDAAESRSWGGSAFEEWAAGAIVAALLGALVLAVALTRAGPIVDYARANTAATAMALLVLAVGASLLAGFAALARERG